MVMCETLRHASGITLCSLFSALLLTVAIAASGYISECVPGFFWHTLYRERRLASLISAEIITLFSEDL